MNKQRFILKQQAKIETLQKELNENNSTKMSKTAVLKLSDNPSKINDQRPQLKASTGHRDEPKTSICIHVYVKHGAESCW